MPCVRIFLLTYRRPVLLRRALCSLLAQTFTDWTCELHNDQPGDNAPQLILNELAPGDPRFCYHPHKINWGPITSFNHVFAGGAEPFATLLEDDNWWEPRFLENAINVLKANLEASLVWANMKLWQEQPDTSWSDTGKTIWTISPSAPAVIEFRWPEVLQAFNALHSTGAMIFRPEKFRTASVPSSTPLVIVEFLRERAALGPILLLTAPLANFALTLRTARDSDPVIWLQAKLLVATSFFKVISVDPKIFEKIWANHRNQCPRDTDFIFCLALALRSWRLLRPSRASDWIHFLPRAMLRPFQLVRALRFRRDHPETWIWLLTQSTAVNDGKPARSTVTAKHI